MRFYVEPILLLDSGAKPENVVNYHSSCPKNLLGWNPDRVFQLGGIVRGMVFFIGIPPVPVRITPEQLRVFELGSIGYRYMDG